MTTDCITHQPAEGFNVTVEAREFFAAAVAAAGVILLLPGASLLMSFLVSQGAA